MSSLEVMFLNACKQNDFEMMEKIIQSSNTATRNTNNNSRTIRFDINFRDSTFKMTPLMLSSIKGTPELVLVLLRHGANILLKDTKGNSALQLACMKQNFRVIDLLLRHHADPNDWNNLGWNSLITAVNYFHEDNSIMLLMLLQAGAKPIHRDIYGLSAVDYAVRKGNLGALRVLLDFSPQSVVENCWSALFYASIRGDFDLAYLLLTYGVDPNMMEGKNGTGIVHEVVRFENKAESCEPSSLMRRVKIVKYLAIYGANPDLKNAKKETPFGLAMKKPRDIAKLYVDALSYYQRSASLSLSLSLRPIFIKQIFDKYSLVKTCSTWTRHEPRFCSTYEPHKTTNLNTNLVDGNLCSMWSFESSNNKPNWVIFDLKSEYSIAMIRLYCWKSKEMPNECFLQTSNSLEGPWITVHSFRAQMNGNSRPNEPGIPCDINGFHAVSRFWRLVIKNNHGALRTSLHGLELFGFDMRLQKLLAELDLSEYIYTLVEHGINQIESLVHLTYDRFEELCIESDSDKMKLWNFVNEFQTKAHLFTPIEWYSEPVAFAVKNQILPPFSVLCKKFISDSLSIIVHGGGIVGGEKVAEVEPFGAVGQSIAFFKDVFFSNSGKFIIEVKSRSDLELNIFSLPIRIFDANDPEYFRVAKIPNKSHMMTQSALTESIYHSPKTSNDHRRTGTAATNLMTSSSISANLAPTTTALGVDFSFTKAAKAKISTWLCKNMSLRRRQRPKETTETTTPSAVASRRSSFLIGTQTSSTTTPTPSQQLFQPPPVTSNFNTRSGCDVETLSVSVDFDSEDEDTTHLVLNKNDFRLFRRRNSSIRRENIRTIKVERIVEPEQPKPQQQQIPIFVVKEDKPKETFVKKAKARRVYSARAKPLTLPLPLPFSIPPPPAEFSFKSSSRENDEDCNGQTGRWATNPPPPPPLTSTNIENNPSRDELNQRAKFPQIQPSDLRNVKLRKVSAEHLK